jgi:hypothetical protein
VGYLLSPPTRQFFGDFGCFVSHVILALFGSFGSGVIICALRWGIYCPLQLGWDIYCPLQLTPPTHPSNWRFFGDFWKFCFARNFLCPSFQGIYCPLQLAPLTRQFFGDFRKSCFARNYLCPLILRSHLCSSCCSSSMCLLFYP